MGTRCDFYTMADSKELTWVGSYGWDGYPDGEPKGMELHKSNSKENFVATVVAFLTEKDGYIAGEKGWPWPWDDSNTTDFSYIYFKGKVYSSCYGSKLIEINDYLDNQEAICDEDEDVIAKVETDIEFKFPDMSKIKDVDCGGKASGLMVFG